MSRSQFPLFRAARAGFTLLEVAVVLVVIGFLVSGVLLGQSLLQNAQMRGVLSDVERFSQAVHEFQAVFNMLPGDAASPGGVPLWPGATGCYGDGDGVIEFSASTGCSEWFAAWRHLSYQALVNGQFAGVPSGAGNLPELGGNVPVSDVTGAGYSFYNISHASAGAHTTLPAANYVGHYIAFGGIQTGLVAYAGGAGGPTQNLPYLGGGAISPEQARAFDAKVDDGTPDEGRVLGTPVSFGRCTTGGTRFVYESSAATKDSRVCNLFFRIDGQ